MWGHIHIKGGKKQPYLIHQDTSLRVHSHIEWIHSVHNGTVYHLCTAYKCHTTVKVAGTTAVLHQHTGTLKCNHVPESYPYLTSERLTRHSSPHYIAVSNHSLKSKLECTPVRCTDYIHNYGILRQKFALLVQFKTCAGLFVCLYMLTVDYAI